jgi:hypothetical protein
MDPDRPSVSSVPAAGPAAVGSRSTVRGVWPAGGVHLAPGVHSTPPPGRLRDGPTALGRTPSPLRRGPPPRRRSAPPGARTAPPAQGSPGRRHAPREPMRQVAPVPRPEDRDPRGPGTARTPRRRPLRGAQCPRHRRPRPPSRSRRRRPAPETGPPRARRRQAPERPGSRTRRASPGGQRRYPVAPPAAAPPAHLPMYPPATWTAEGFRRRPACRRAPAPCARPGHADRPRVPPQRSSKGPR